MVKERTNRLFSPFGFSLLQNRMDFPNFLIATEFRQPRVLDLQQPALFQIRLDDAPTPPQVLV